MSTVTIPVGSDYDVRIGRGILAEVADFVPSGTQRVLVVHSGAQPYAHRVAQVLAHNGFEVLYVVQMNLEYVIQLVVVSIYLPP